MALIDIFGEPVQDFILKQIKGRGEIFAKEGKTSKEQIYIHGNTPWILLRSGVDTVTGSSLAKNRVLMGGSLYNGQYTSGINFTDKKEGNEWREYSYGPTGFSVDSLGTGEKTTPRVDMGIRPAPGITGLTVKTLGESGIMEATVKFKVWSADDFDEINAVYFRPGFSALVEWGHSMWLDNEVSGDDRVKSLKNMQVSDDLWFSGSDLETIHKKIWGDIKNPEDNGIIGRTCGNYCGLVGYITNFTYEFDGKSYDCSLKILGGSSITQFMTIKSTDTVTNIEEKNVEDTQREKTSDNNAVVTLLNNLSKDIIDSDRVSINVPEGTELTDRPKKSYGAAKDGKLVERFNAKRLLGSIGKPMQVVRLYLSGKSLNYIQLCDFLWLCNEKAGIATKFAINTGHRYASSDKTFSLDPIRVLVPNPNATNKISKIFDESKESWNQIGNIYLETSYLAQELKNESKLNTVIANILKTIQSALGEVNQFELLLSDFCIVDKNHIQQKNSPVDKQIQAVGLKSIVKSLKINSSITQDMANYFSTVAQVDGVKDTALPQQPELLYLAGKCTDRHKPTSNSEKSSTWDDVKRAFENNTNVLYSLMQGKDSVGGGENEEKLLQGTYESIVKWYREHGPGIKNAGRSYFTGLVETDFFNAGKGSSGALHTGAVPIKVNLTMMGTSGFRLYETFTIGPGYMPSIYDKWGYIITGIDHNVSSKGWDTTLTTQYYPIVTQKNVDNQKR